MGRRRKKRLRFWLFASFLLLIAGGIYGILNYPESPEIEMKQAYASLVNAKKAQADIYAPKQYTEAKDFYDSAFRKWKAENEKFFFSRDFSMVKITANQSKNASIRAASLAFDNIKKSSASVQTTLSMLENEVNIFHKTFMKLPIPQKLIKDFSRGKLQLEEAKIAWKKGQFDLAGKRLDGAKRLIINTIKVTEDDIENYFRNFSTWDAEVAQTLKISKANNQTVIIIDKFAQECRVYTNGNLRRTFNVELGPNWLGDKKYQGDRSTPEGMYKVIDKKERRHTIYYKALLIDYPNQEDRNRFYNLKAKGIIPRNSSIGGLIEIHGEGGKGFHWTNGCVALENRDMDVLYRMASVNTPVTIVGSLIPYREWKIKMLNS